MNLCSFRRSIPMKHDYTCKSSGLFVSFAWQLWLVCGFFGGVFLFACLFSLMLGLFTSVLLPAVCNSPNCVCACVPLLGIPGILVLPKLCSGMISFANYIKYFPQFGLVSSFFFSFHKLIALKTPYSMSLLKSMMLNYVFVRNNFTFQKLFL